MAVVESRTMASQNPEDDESTLSDALLRQLMAVGQVDVLVGLPTLNNAATVVDVVRAIHVCFTRDFPRLRTVLINADGGSTDGTPELVRAASVTDADVVQTSYTLRTLHRVVAPYHGLPGKHAALRTVFAAGELARASVIVVLDPGGPATTAERVTELIGPIGQSGVEFLAPRYRRHPRDGVLITQLVRPLTRALYGVGLDEPLGAEFACSGRFASHCLEQAIWDQKTARFAIDLWLRMEAIAEGFPVGQIWRPLTAATGARTTVREAVHQVVVSAIESLQAHDLFWLRTNGVAELCSWGIDPVATPEAPTWDYQALALQARHDIGEIKELLETVLEPGLLPRLLDASDGASPTLDDELWVRIVYAFAAAARQGRAGVDHLADMFAPAYMWRAAAFMSQTARESSAAVQARLNSLCETFERLKPELVAAWSAGE
jgi:glucosylglycerate synthase